MANSFCHFAELTPRASLGHETMMTVGSTTRWISFKQALNFSSGPFNSEITYVTLSSVHKCHVVVGHFPKKFHRVPFWICHVLCFTILHITFGLNNASPQLPFRATCNEHVTITLYETHRLSCHVMHSCDCHLSFTILWWLTCDHLVFANPRGLLDLRNLLVVYPFYDYLTYSHHLFTSSW